MGGGLDAAAQGIDLGTHHVHADAPPGQLGHMGGGREAGHEDQVGQLALGHLLAGPQQPLLHRLVADARQVQAGAVVTAIDADLVAFLEKEAAARGFALQAVAPVK